MRYIHKVYGTGRVWTDPPCTPEAERHILSLLEKVYRLEDSLKETPEPKKDK